MVEIRENKKKVTFKLIDTYLYMHNKKYMLKYNKFEFKGLYDIIRAIKWRAYG